MAGKTQVSWKDVVTKAATDSGLPKKTIEESFTAVVNTVETIAKEQRPKEIGGELTIKTPLAAIRIRHLSERVVTNPKTGEQWQRPACFGASYAPTRTMLDSINTGISLDKKPIAGTAPKAAADVKAPAKATKAA